LMAVCQGWPIFYSSSLKWPMGGWRLQRQGRRWFLGIIIAHLPKILSRNIGCLEFVFRGSQVIKSKKLLLRIIDYLEIIFPGIQVDRVATALNTTADED